MDISPLKFKERDILEMVFKFWKRTSKEEFQITACWDQRLRKHLGTRYDAIPNVFDWDCSITLHDRQATQINPREYEKWRQKGVAFVLREAEYTSPNRSLGSGRMFTLPNGEKKVYWGYWGDITCSPYLAFGIDTSRYPDLAKTVNGQKAYGATITSEVNVRSLLWELENHRDCPLSIAAPFCVKSANKKKQGANSPDKTGDNHEGTETSKPSGSGSTEGKEETEEDEHRPDLSDGDSKMCSNKYRKNSEELKSETTSFEDRLNNIPYAPLELPSPFMVHMLPANSFCDLPTRFRSIFLSETPETIDVIYVGCSVAHLLDSPKLLGSQDAPSSEAGLKCKEEENGKQSEEHESKWTHGIHDLLSSKSLLIVESILYMVQMRQAQIEAYVTRITNMASKLSFKIWRGVPYAQPPTRENNLRFRRPIPPIRSKAKYDATFFRDSCSQPDSAEDSESQTWFQSPYEWMKRLPVRQTARLMHSISEDCLYMNIYTLNETDYGGGNTYPGVRRKLPILVFFDGADHLTGTANRFPGHVLAQLGIVVVSVNYRLGPMGFLSTRSNEPVGDPPVDAAHVALGNYGLWDQIRALEFIKENAEKFLGDPNQITVVGHGSAAADVALHLLSRKSGRRVPALFHRAVLMSGSDQVEGGFVKSAQESKMYAIELAHQVGCDVTTQKQMLECFRARTARELSTAAGQTRIHRPQWLTKPWAPTVDGDLIEDSPEKLWKDKKFAHIPVIGGLTADDGAVYALASLFQLPNSSITDIFDASAPHPRDLQMSHRINFSGLSREEQQLGFYEMAQRDFALDPVAVSRALSYEYTDWRDITDAQRRWCKYRDAWTDRLFGSGIVQTLRYHSQGNDSLGLSGPRRTQMYVFAFKSPTDTWTNLLGAYGGSELQYLFGLPRLTLHRDPEEIASQWPSDLNLEPPLRPYTALELNITDYMLYFISNFVKSGNATPVPVRNLTWDTYRPENRTYLWLNLTDGYEFSRSHQPELEQLGVGAGFDLRQNYRVYEHAYWSQLYPAQLTWPPRFTPPQPTPAYLEHYQTSALSLSGILAIVCIISAILFIVYCRKRKLLL
ncbi:unnamed protein product [Calicophoron daubneyi]|uniref:Uncharacterized protein n=1 Tax=Calicophoron daubneyi TaxID=300641 RepID=A0AAV2T2P4_CALDB